MKIFNIAALMLGATLAFGCVPYDRSGSGEDVAEAEGAVFAVYNDPTEIKAAITAGATYWPELMALNVGTVESPSYKQPKLDDGAWILVDAGAEGALPLLAPGFAFLCAGTIWDEAESLAQSGGESADYAGFVYTADNASCGVHTFGEMWQVMTASTYPGYGSQLFFRPTDP